MTEHNASNVNQEATIKWMRNIRGSLQEYEGFADRDAYLRAMGFMSYEDYLKSDLWSWITSRLGQLSLAKCCEKCGGKFGLVWHHRTYSLSVLVGNFTMYDHARWYFTPNAEENPVVRLCSPCHKHCHYSESGEWVGDMRDVDYRMRARRPPHVYVEDEF